MNAKFLAASVLVFSSFSASVQALILDFTEVSNGFQGATTIDLSNATINSFGSDSFVYHPGDFGALGGGGFCGIDFGSCAAGAEVLFDFAVSGLTFNTQYFDAGDSTTLGIYSGAALLDSVVVTSDTAVDFSAYSGITRLAIDDNSTGAGFGYTNFNFDRSADVPVPTSLALLGLGLLGLARVRRRSA